MYNLKEIKAKKSALSLLGCDSVYLGFRQSCCISKHLINEKAT